MGALDAGAGADGPSSPPSVLHPDLQRAPALCCPPPADSAVSAGYPDSAGPHWTSRCQGRLLSICRDERRAESWGGCRAGRLGQPGPAVAVSSADSRLGGTEALKRPSLAALADALELFCWDRCALGGH